MNIGDLVDFWDYDGGGGHVTGLVVDIRMHQYSTSIGECMSLAILYNDTIQLVPIDDEWVRPTEIIT